MVKHIQNSIDKALIHQSKINDAVLAVEGFSAPKNRHFLNNLLNIKDARYLEIGVWNGSTFISSLYKNIPEYAVAIDNWSTFHGKRSIFEDNCKNIIDHTNYEIYESDCFAFDKTQFKHKFNIYFYDGEHNEPDHYNALNYYLDSLDDVFIYICDDWNWDKVKNGTKNAINSLELKIIREWELNTNTDETGTPICGDVHTWWNGLYVAVLEKPKIK